MNTCIYCGSKEALNTEFSITIEDSKKVSLLVCDACADDASPKTAKAKYAERQAKVQEFMAQAETLGLKFTADEPPRPSGILVAQAAPSAPGQEHYPGREQYPGEAADAVFGTDDGMVRSTQALDALSDKELVSVSGHVEGLGRLGAHQKLRTEEIRRQLPKDALKGKVRMESFAGRGGQPLVLPATRIDGTGMTTLRVVETGGDPALQKRFKSLADDSRRDRQPDFRNEYDVKPCPICHGEMNTMNNGILITCPKCKGRGTIE